MTRIRIRLFGAFAVSVEEAPVHEAAWRLRKAKSLVKLLALAPDRRVHRERATELLWPERTADAAANNFHQALYVARRALEAAGAETSTVLPLRDDMLVLNPGGTVEVDVDAFEAAAARARETGEVPAYRSALELHSGELLPEDRYEPWAAGRREALNEARLGLLLDLSARLAEGGEPDAAIEALEQIVVLDPLHEAAHRSLMRLFAAGGRRQQALLQYQRLRESLRRDLAAEPDPQTVRLHRALLRGEAGPGLPDVVPPAPAAPKAAPARRARADAPPHNLPIALTSFVGRDRELREVAALLDRTRMLTLTGAGGSGKTRLALEAATARLGACPEGVWLVELAGLADPELVPAATAAAIGLTPPSGRPAADSLVAHLAGWRALLVLDNAEHLVGACAVLAERLLGAAPGLRILATSREPLRVPGEVTWRVPSLALPARGRSASAAELGRYESVRLFCERAGDVLPGFALDDGNAGAVEEICLRLDGMPLALELAAARVGAISPAQIADRLGDSLAVLTAGSRSILDRQQTLRGTLSWSHALLGADERTLFRRLGVFAGTFSLEAAEEVPAGEGLERRDVADVLGRLVDKSLVVAEEGAARYRYRLLESMRQYAREHLVEAGEASGFDARHHAFYLRLARTADPEAPGSGPAVTPDGLAADDDNLRAALAWALRHDASAAVRLAVHLWPTWMARSRFEEGSRWLRAALAAAPEPTALRAEALRAVCGIDVRLGQTSQLGATGDERLEIFRALGDPPAVAHALDEVGVYEYMAGRYDRAEARYRESLALGEQLGDAEVVAAALHSHAVLRQCRGDFPGAADELLRSLARLRSLPAEGAERFFRVHTVGLFVAVEPPRRLPRMYFEETVQFFRRVDARRAIGYVLAGLGDVARAQGLREPARERLHESLAHFREARDAMGTAFTLNRLGILAGAMGEPELGREWLEESLALRRDLGDRRGAAMTVGNLGILAAHHGDPERGEALIADALRRFEETGDAPGQMGMRLNLGNLAADAREHARARELLEASAAMAERQLLFRCAGWSTLTLAEVALDAGDARRARDVLAAALARLEPMGDRLGVARALELGEAAAKWSLSGPEEG